MKKNMAQSSNRNKETKNIIYGLPITAIAYFPFRFSYRLEAYERNLNFQDEPLLIPGPSITSWPEWGFKELSVSHHDMIPKLHKSVVEGYFVYRQVCDQAGAKDLKALAKGTRLLEARNIDAMSFFRDESAIFYTGIVRAAMKKKVRNFCSVCVFRNLAVFM